ncbi:hypothetical protein LUZ60_002425 [Juncus effusus]|nr:hypothetical protein LUZ60_002425 [Juncus effusus]
MNTPNPRKGTKNPKYAPKGGSGSNFRWSPSTSRFLLTYISEKAKTLGNPNFKRKCFSNAAQAVSDRYGISVTDTNVLNHVRTIRNRYKLVRKLQALENTTWDDERKMVVMSPNDYDDYIRENPKDEPYINKRIDMYNEICVLCEEASPTAQDLSGSDNEEIMRDSENELDDSANVSSNKRRRIQGQTAIIPTPKKGSGNFRWSPYMSRLLLSFIVEQIKLGKVKRQILTSASLLIQDRMDLNCSVVNVENHLRTIRLRFLRIKKLQGMEGVEWDEEKKMISIDDEAYNEHIKNEPKDEPYLNKKIDMYDEMVTIFETEWTTNQEEGRPALTDGLDLILNEINAQNEPAEHSTSPIRRSPLNNGERNGNNNEFNDQSESAKWAMNKLMKDISSKMGSLAKSMGDLANAVRSSSERGICEELYREVMKCEGYNEDLLGKAFDYLNEHTHLGRGFLVKSQRLRQDWLSEFFTSCGHVL